MGVGVGVGVGVDVSVGVGGGVSGLVLCLFASIRSNVHPRLPPLLLSYATVLLPRSGHAMI